MWWWPKVGVPAGRVVVVNGGAAAERWGRIYTDDGDVARRAAADFLATARDVGVTVDNSADPAPVVRVLGTGLLAALVREQLGSATADGALTVIDTTGEVEQIRSAVAALPRFGRLILAAPPRRPVIQLATYRDIHVRALTLVGVPWGLRQRCAVDRRAVDELLQREPLSPDPRARWYIMREGEHD